jgi:hypothetical protein
MGAAPAGGHHRTATGARCMPQKTPQQMQKIERRPGEFAA